MTTAKTMPLMKVNTAPRSYGQRVTVGTYIGCPASAYEEPLRLTAIACPYCRGFVSEKDTTRRIARIVRVLSERADGSVECFAAPIPTTHVLLYCYPCDARFVAPREHLTQPPSADAVGQRSE